MNCIEMLCKGFVDRVVTRVPSLAVIICAAISTMAGSAAGADIPKPGVPTTVLREINRSGYEWRVTPAGKSAELLTLFCRSCEALKSSDNGVPLVAVLRDTLGDSDRENDRVSYIWLLTYARPNLGQRLLSAVPFFYWRVTDGSRSVSRHDTAPLLDLTAPQHPVASEISRTVMQWMMFDPLTTPVRAASRAYRTNEIDHERLHLEEAIGYLRNAPVGNADNALTEGQLNTVIARLELRKRLLGGLVSERRAMRLGEEYGFEEERIRSRNWEVLRQCAEKTGLLFEPLNLAGNDGQYAVLWFPLGRSFQDPGTSLSAVWKVLKISNPWTDVRLKHWQGRDYDRAIGEDRALMATGQPGAHEVRLIPLAIYSLTYPQVPLLLLDFRDKLHIRRHEMAQRTVNEVTAGVIGISHFTNWYYYVAADVYNFVRSRHGAAVNQAARLDCYSAFRVDLALDHQLDPALRKEMETRIESLAVNPLEGAANRELELAQTRYARLQAAAQNGGELLARLDNDRRAELARFGENGRRRLADNLLHDASLGLYTHRARENASNVALLDRERRLEYDLNFLDSLVHEGTQPEVAYNPVRIQARVTELSSLLPGVRAGDVRLRAKAALEKLQGLSQDAGLQSDCSIALAALGRDENPPGAVSESNGATATGTLALIKPGPEPRK